LHSPTGTASLVYTRGGIKEGLQTNSARSGIGFANEFAGEGSPANRLVSEI